MQQAMSGDDERFEPSARPRNRDQLLEAMERDIPWTTLELLIEPHYASAFSDRQPMALSVMLRVYFLQQCFHLTDGAADLALRESAVLRRFAGLDFAGTGFAGTDSAGTDKPRAGFAGARRAALPDELSILCFRHLMEQNEYCAWVVDAVTLPLESLASSECPQPRKTNLR